MSLRNLKVRCITEKRGKWYVAYVITHPTLGELFPDMGKPDPEMDALMDELRAIVANPIKLGIE